MCPASALLLPRPFEQMKLRFLAASIPEETHMIRHIRTIFRTYTYHTYYCYCLVCSCSISSAWLFQNGIETSVHVNLAPISTGGTLGDIGTLVDLGGLKFGNTLSQAMPPQPFLGHGSDWVHTVNLRMGWWLGSIKEPSFGALRCVSSCTKEMDSWKMFFLSQRDFHQASSE